MITKLYMLYDNTNRFTWVNFTGFLAIYLAEMCYCAIREFYEYQVH